MANFHFVFDAFPSPAGSRFIELENDEGRSLGYGEWRDRFDGHVALVIPDHRPLLESALSKLEAIYDPEDDGLYELRDKIRVALGLEAEK